ncbi:MAG: hypothetical protein LC664_16710, partial [Flavobacteriales bacterium]|nr:hypothetical protein [Flavobacteriales bacterium]
SVMGKMEYIQGRDWKYNAQKNFITWKNGSKTILKDLFLYPSDPDFQSLGSTEYTDVFIDESPEITLKAFDILKSRIRYKIHDNGLIPKIYLTGNPQPGWVKERFVSNEHGDPVKLKANQAFIKATVLDNPDPEFVRLYTKQLEDLESDYDRARLLYGDWEANREVLRPFAHNYDENVHVGDCVHNPKTMTMVLVDFNVDPYCANIFNAWRDDNGPHCHQVDEIEFNSGTIDEMAERIKTAVGSAITSMYLGGDAMGRNRTIGMKDNKSLFQRLRESLGISKNQIKVVNNPGHGVSRNDVNYFLKHYPFKVSRLCTGTRRDLRSVEVDAYGSIMKKNRSDVSQRADFLDNVRYLVNTFYKTAIKKHRKTGKW